jgi:hypothetical protein
MCSPITRNREQALLNSCVHQRAQLAKFANQKWRRKKGQLKIASPNDKFKTSSLRYATLSNATFAAMLQNQRVSHLMNNKCSVGTSGKKTPKFITLADQSTSKTPCAQDTVSRFFTKMTSQKRPGLDPSRNKFTSTFAKKQLWITN